MRNYALSPSTLIQLRRHTLECSPWSTKIEALFDERGNVMSPGEIRDVFALPYTPTAAAVVHGYPDGTNAYVGTAAANQFGRGGAFQIFGESPAEIGETFALDDLLAMLRSNRERR